MAADEVKTPVAKRLLGLLDNLAIQVESGTDAETGVDYVNRVAAIAKGEDPDRALAQVAARTAVFFGHPLPSFQEGLWKSVEGTPEYRAVVADEAGGKPTSLDKLDILSKYLADTFTNTSKATGALASQLRAFAADLFRRGAEALVPEGYREGRAQVDLPALLERFPEHAKIVRALSDAGFTLAGSAALSTQGTVLRSAENPFHDLDFTVPLRVQGESAEAQIQVVLDALGYNQTQFVYERTIASHEQVATVGVDAAGDGHTTYSMKVPLSPRHAFVVNEMARGKSEIAQIVDRETGRHIPKEQFDDYTIIIDLFPYQHAPVRKVAGVRVGAWNHAFAAKAMYIREKDGLRSKDAADFIFFRPQVAAHTKHDAAEQRFTTSEDYGTVPIFQHYGLKGFEDAPALKSRLKEAIAKLKALGFPPELLDGIAHFARITKNATDGLMWENKLIVGIDEELLKSGTLDELVATLAHEVSHDADFQLHKGRAQSHVSPLFAVDIAPDGRWSLGPVLKELFAAYTRDTSGLRGALEYPFKHFLKAVSARDEDRLAGIKSEAFAQASVLYFTRPDALRAAAPTTFATLEAICSPRPSSCPTALR